MARLHTVAAAIVGLVVGLQIGLILEWKTPMDAVFNSVVGVVDSSRMDTDVEWTREMTSLEDLDDNTAVFSRSIDAEPMGPDPVVSSMAELNDLAVLRNQTVIVRGRIIPTIFLIGAQKSGSTTFFDLLKRSKLIVRGKHKEFFYFNKPRALEKPIETSYIDQFPYMPSNIDPFSTRLFTIDASTAYMTTPSVPLSILNAYTSPALRARLRIMAVLRNPVDRFVSWYQHCKTERRSSYPWTHTEEFSTFDRAAVTLLKEAKECQDQGKDVWLDKDCWEATKGLSWGYYGQILEQWLRFFPKNQVHVVPFTSLASEESGEFREQLEWVGEFIMGAGHAEELWEGLSLKTARASNQGETWAKPDVSEAARTAVAEHYAPHDERLVQLLRRLGYTSFPPWF